MSQPATTAALIEVFDWLAADGTPFGCGSRAEFLHWQREGVVAPDARLGAVVGHEPASEDARRAKLWGAA